MTPVDRLGAVIDLPALAEFPADRWFADRDAIKALIRDHLATRATVDWLAMLEPAGIWAAPVLDWPALMAEPGFTALAATQQVRSPEGAALTLTRCPIRIDGAILTSPRAAPRLGADRTSIDRELGQ
jgi:crotonobetainyl-CoA:carnitine CoA-transferase CaiB-like acyl-CoA transferase